MEIEELIKYLESTQKLGNYSHTRGNIIDLISQHKDRWIMVLKALLIKNVKKKINTTYLLEKLRFMQKIRINPNFF